MAFCGTTSYKVSWKAEKLPLAKKKSSPKASGVNKTHILRMHLLSSPNQEGFDFIQAVKSTIT